jgi:hypothetical protein
MRLMAGGIRAIFFLFFVASTVTLQTIPLQAGCTFWKYNLERLLLCRSQTVRYEYLVGTVTRRKSIIVKDTDRTELISCY